MRLLITLSSSGKNNFLHTTVHSLCNLTILIHPDWFNVLDKENCHLLTEHEVLQNLQSIMQDMDQTPITEFVHFLSFSLHLESMSRSYCHQYAYHRKPKDVVSIVPSLAEDCTSAACLQLISNVLFIVYLDNGALACEGVNSYCDDRSEEDLAALWSTFCVGHMTFAGKFKWGCVQTGGMRRFIYVLN